MTSVFDIQVLSASSYLYPDFSASRGKPGVNEFKTPENLLNPVLIVEVLSASTAAADRGENMLYRQITSLRQYLLVDSQSAHAELYIRQDNAH